MKPNQPHANSIAVYNRQDGDLSAPIFHQSQRFVVPLLVNLAAAFSAMLPDLPTPASTILPLHSRRIPIALDLLRAEPCSRRSNGLGRLHPSIRRSDEHGQEECS
jgi:hypothetical protein